MYFILTHNIVPKRNREKNFVDTLFAIQILVKPLTQTYKLYWKP